MKNRLTLMIVAVLMTSVWLSAAEIIIQVRTDKSNYHIGQTVNWSVYAWSVPNSNNKGISLISFNLSDSRGETLSLPNRDAHEFTGSEYGVDESFIVAGPGTITSTAPQLRDMTVMQMLFDRQLNIGNDNVPRLVASGQFQPAKVGSHSLEVSLNGANYWNYYENPVPFETQTPQAASYGVYARGDINFDGAVDVLDLAVLAGQWLGVPGTPSADIAPLSGDGLVDMADFAVLAAGWLSH